MLGATATASMLIRFSGHKTSISARNRPLRKAARHRNLIVASGLFNEINGFRLDGPFGDNHVSLLPSNVAALVIVVAVFAT